MKKYALFITTLFLSFSLFSSTAFAQDPLIGYWSNSKIKLHLKTGSQYTYEVKILGVTKNFIGKWSADGKTKTLTLNYTLLGSHVKTATYSFNNGDLLLLQKGKTSRLKKKI
ncbi:MAG: hypothetical protein KAH03_02825 [Cocleimonas sp.]|nr:hypothetical protein [Cocleimonas sp.]